MYFTGPTKTTATRERIDDNNTESTRDKDSEIITWMMAERTVQTRMAEKVGK